MIRRKTTQLAFVSTIASLTGIAKASIHLVFEENAVLDFFFRATNGWSASFYIVFKETSAVLYWKAKIIEILAMNKCLINWLIRLHVGRARERGQVTWRDISQL